MKYTYVETTLEAVLGCPSYTDSARRQDQVATRQAAWMCGNEFNNDPQEARRAIDVGRAWPATLAAYQKTRAEMNPDDMPRMRKARRARTWDDIHGCEADLGRALVGVAPWIQFQHTAARRAVTVGIELSMSGHNGAAEFRRNIVAAVTLCDALVEAGYDVRIVGTTLGAPGNMCWSDDTTYFGFSFPLKEFGAPLDQEGLLAFGTPCFSRFWLFRAFSALFPAIQDLSGYGRPDVPPLDFMAMTGIDILVARQWSSASTEQDFVHRLYKELQAKLEGAAS